MTANETHEPPALSVRAQGDLVELTVYSETIELTPRQAQHFAHWLAKAYIQAAGGVHRNHQGNVVLKDTAR